MKKKTLCFPAALVLSLAMVGCGQAESSNQRSDQAAFCPASTTKELVKKARDEGKVEWYLSASNIDEAAKQAFESKYGITVESLRLPSSDLNSRFASEQEAGVHSADVYLVSYEGQGHLEDWVRKGLLFRDLSEAGIPGYPWGFPKSYLHGAAATVQVRTFGIVYNTNLVQNPPHTWKDLLDPKWKGNILIADPASSQVYTDFWTDMGKKFGRQYLEALKAQNPRIAESATPATQMVAAEGAEVAIPINGGVVAGPKSQGAPVALSTPSETFGPEFVVSLVASAPHPYAACLLTKWLMSPAGNKVISDAIGVKEIREFESPVTLPAATDQEREKVKAFWDSNQ